MSEVDGIDYLISESNQGVSMIRANLVLNKDPNVAIAEVQAKVASQRSVLPREALDPVIDLQAGRAFSLLYLAFVSEEMNPSQITDYLMRGPIPKLQAVPGVAKARISGNQVFAMRIWLDPKRMVASNVTAAEVRVALQRNNFQAGVGKTKGDLIATSLTTDTSISDVEAFRQLIIRSDEDTLVRMRDVAEVALDARNYDQTSWFNGTPAIMVGIEAAPGANPLQVSDAVRALVADIEQQLPETLNLHRVHDGSQYIEDSINEVLRTLAEAMVIVLIIILLSLGSWHAAIIPSLSVPLALIGAGSIMLLLGYSLNLLTLLALLLAIGLVVDDAIVVVENVHRHILMGKTPYQAALDGARELALPIISMTTTLLAVYLPIAFMDGLAGILFSEFAFSLAGAVVISGIIALVFSPMLASKVLNSSDEPERFEQAVEHFFERLADTYARWLEATLKYVPVTVVFSAVIIASIYAMYSSSKSELAPAEDREVLNIQIKAPETATLEYSAAYIREIVKIYETFPEHIRNFLLIGGGGTPATSFGGVRFVPVAEREKSQTDLQRELQSKVNNIAGVRVAVFSFPALPGAAQGAPLQFVITSDQEYQQLDDLASEMIDAAMQSRQFVYMDKSMDMSLPLNRIRIDRDRAGDLGVNMDDIGVTLATMLGGNYVNRFSLQGRSYEVIPQVMRPYRGNFDQLDQFYVRSASGELVPLSGVVSYETVIEPTRRTQFQQLNAVTISAIPAPGVSLGDAISFIEAEAEQRFPREFSYDYTGESRQFKQQGSALVLTFFLSLLVIYLVLAAQFESWRDPLIILMSVPMSIAGAMIFITLGFASLNLYTQVGLITLIGLIAKNGILIVDFANRVREEQGATKLQAVIEAARIRLRPILMTTLAMLMAMVPLLIASGPGAVSRFQIGLVIATGLGIGTLFTLFVVPAFYLLLAKENRY